MYSIAFSPKELLSIPNEQFASNHETFDACFWFNALFGNTYPQDTGQCDQSDIEFMLGRLFGSLRWCHNGHDGVSNHQHHHCLLDPLFRRRSKKTSKLRVAGLCVGNSPGTGEFPAQMASNAENVSIWWRHHGLLCYHIQDNDPLFLLTNTRSVELKGETIHWMKLLAAAAQACRAVRHAGYTKTRKQEFIFE